MQYIIFNELGAEPYSYIGQYSILYPEDVNVNFTVNTLLPKYVLKIELIDGYLSLHSSATTIESIVFSDNLSSNLSIGVSSLLSNINISPLNTHVNLSTSVTDIKGLALYNVVDTILPVQYYKATNEPISYVCGRYLDTPYDNRFLNTQCN